MSSQFALFLLFLPLVSTFAQDQKKTLFENLSIDPAGHVCYVESLDENPLNRIEFRTNGKNVVSIFVTDHATKVEITDYDSDGMGDVIYVEKEEGKRDVKNSTFYRGDEFQRHLQRHLQHALRTAMHPLIAEQPEEKARADQIRSTLERLTERRIPPEEVGIYSSETMFEASASKDIRYAFSASDTLNSALQAIVNGDYRVLSQEPHIVKKYNIEIKILTSVEPLEKKK